MPGGHVRLSFKAVIGVTHFEMACLMLISADIIPNRARSAVRKQLFVGVHCKDS